MSGKNIDDIWKDATIRCFHPNSYMLLGDAEMLYHYGNWARNTIKDMRGVLIELGYGRYSPTSGEFEILNPSDVGVKHEG